MLSLQINTYNKEIKYYQKDILERDSIERIYRSYYPFKVRKGVSALINIIFLEILVLRLEAIKATQAKTVYKELTESLINIIKRLQQTNEFII